MQREISRSTDFSTSDVSCLFTTFFAVLRSIDEKKKKGKKRSEIASSLPGQNTKVRGA